MIRTTKSSLISHNSASWLLDGNHYNAIDLPPDSVSHHAASTLSRVSGSEKPLSTTIVGQSGIKVRTALGLYVSRNPSDDEPEWR